MYVIKNTLFNIWSLISLVNSLLECNDPDRYWPGVEFQIDHTNPTDTLLI